MIDLDELRQRHDGTYVLPTESLIGIADLHALIEVAEAARVVADDLAEARTMVIGLARLEQALEKFKGANP